MLVAGVDSSTQSTKVLLCEAEDGTIVARASAPHPGGTECPPQAWAEALAKAGDGLLYERDVCDAERLRAEARFIWEKAAFSSRWPC